MSTATLAFFGLLVRTNLRASLALRASFWLQAVFMFLNNLVYFAIWAIFFQRFHDLGGFQLADMWLAYGVVAGGFGMAVALGGGLRDLARLIVEGGLDTYLTQPKPVLLQALCARSLASGWGDLLSGLLMIGVSGRVSLAHAPFALLAIAISASVFLAAGVIFHSAAFWLGPVDSLARSMWEFMITFSVYPETVFGGSVRVLLFTLIPAGYSGILPAKLAAQPSLAHFTAAFGGAVCVVSLALVIFGRGLRRYESGNQIGAR